MLISFSDLMNFADGDLQSSLNNSSGHAAISNNQLKSQYAADDTCRVTDTDLISVFSYLRQLTWHCSHLLLRFCCAVVPLLLGVPWLPLSIDISCPHSAQQWTRGMPPLQSYDGTERRMDNRPFHRPCSAYYSGSADNITTESQHMQFINAEDRQWVAIRTYEVFKMCIFLE